MTNDRSGLSAVHRRSCGHCPIDVMVEEASGGARLRQVDRVSPIPGVERWSYGAFRQDHESESITVPVVRDDGESAEFTVPKFVEDPEDLRAMATVVIEAFQKWEAVQGLGG